MNLRSAQQEDTPPGNSGSFSPFDAYEVSWRARAEEVALHLSGDTPRIWVPRSCQTGLGDLAGWIIERFMEKSSGDSKRSAADASHTDGDGQGKSILPRNSKAPPASYRKVHTAGALTRIMHETASRDRGDGCATGQPQGLGPEAYLSVRRKVRDPRTPGRTAISAVAAGGSCIMRVKFLSDASLAIRQKLLVL